MKKNVLRSLGIVLIIVAMISLAIMAACVSSPCQHIHLCGTEMMAFWPELAAVLTFLVGAVVCLFTTKIRYY